MRAGALRSLGTTAEAGAPYGSRFLPCLIVRPSGSRVRLARVGRAAPPPCAGRNPSLRSIASALAPHPLGVLLAASTFIQSCRSLRPQVARASRCRWALQPISLLGTNPAGRLTRILRVSCWPPLPHSRAGAGGDCLQASAAGGFGLPTPAEWTHSVSCWQSIPFYSASTLIQSCITLCDRRSLGPAAPPPAGSDTRRCSCLRAGRLTHTRWIFYWQSLPSDSKSRRPAALPLRRAEISHRSIGPSAGCDLQKNVIRRPHRENRSFPARRENPVQKQFMLLNDFPPLSVARGAARHPKRAAYTLKRVLFFLTALRLFSSSPLGRDPKRSLRSPAASVVNRKN